MRVLSFIPAFLLAAASFVVAAPTSSDSSCVPSGGSGNDAALQPVIDIIANATVHIQPLHDHLSDMSGGPCEPDDVVDVVVQVKAVVDLCISQLQAVAKIDLSLVSLDRLCATIYAHLSLLLGVISVLVKICLSLQVSALVAVKASISDLLNVVLNLIVCLNIYAIANVDVLADICVVVKAVVDLCLSIVLGVKVN